MPIDKNFPIYLGVSQEFFTRMQELNILDGDAKFTTSMAEAEKDAKEFTAKCEAKAKRGFANIGRVLISLFMNKPQKIESKVRGIVVKFDTAKLASNYLLLEFGDEIRVSTEVLQSVMLYINGFYEVVDIEELVEGDLYA